PMFEAIAPHDLAGVLQDEWLNSRGAIARFDRHAIEIRVLDAQESVAADLAAVAAVVSLVKAHVDGVYGSSARLATLETDRLAKVFDQVLAKGADAKVADANFLAMMGPRCSGTFHGFWVTVCRDLASRGYPIADFIG